MSVINVTVTNPGNVDVTVTGGSTVNAVVGNGGAVNVSTGTISPGDADVVSGTLALGTVTTLAAGSSATATNVGTAYSAIINLGIPSGAAGPANTLAIGTVTASAPGSSASATITGSSPSQTLSMVLPRGETGPANTLSIGTVTTGAAGSSASASIAGTAPNQTLSLTIPVGATGAQGVSGAVGAAGVDGLQVEIQATATHIQWRYVGGSTWTNLVALSTLTGPQGVAGDAVEFNVSSTHIQWRYVGGSTYTDLVALSAITGAQGIPGATGATGPAGPQGIPGTDGADVEFQFSATHLQYRLIGDTTWIDLIAKSSLTGPQGDAGDQVEFYVSATHIQWRYVGGSTYTDLVALSTLTGATGAPANLTVGTVTTGTAAVTLTGTAPNYTINFVLPAVGEDAAIDGGVYAAAAAPSGDDPLWSSVRLLMPLDTNTNDFRSGTGSTVTAFGNAAIATSSPKFGAGSLLLDGNGDYLQIVDSFNEITPGTGDFTVEAWVRPAFLSAEGNYLFDTRTSEIAGYGIYLTSSSTVVYTASAVITGQVLTAGQWQHVALCRASGTLRLFIAGSVAGSPVANTTNFASNRILLGRSFSDLSPYWFDGNIDDVRYTSAARYTGTFTPPTSAHPTS